ncbi:MAG: glycosyltransferase family 39 protein [Anaerolineae bacterium]|nr:glycosyltransferase family 39 protein [Anaerolineae bacterium]
MLTTLNRPQTRHKLILLLGITLLAAFFRFYRLDTLPPGDGYDQAWYGVDALEILRGARPVYLPTNHGREVMFSYLVALFTALLGANPFAIHVASALVGLLAVPAVFLMAETMFADEDGWLRKYGGLTAALMVAVSYWDLQWSRHGVRAILVPLFTALIVYTLWRGLRTGSRAAFVGCGVCLGLSLYTYQAARLLPVLVVLAFLLVRLDRQKFRGATWQGFATVVGVSLLVFAPLGLYVVQHPGEFNQRIEQTLVLTTDESGSPVATLGSQVVKALLAFNFRGDERPLSNIPYRPALNAVLSLLFFLGLGLSLRRVRRSLYAFLLVWMAVMTVPAMLAGIGPAEKRAIGTLPAVAMLIALGLLGVGQAVYRWASARGVDWARRVPTGVALLGLAAFVYTGVVTYRDYFLIWGRDPDLFTHFEAGRTAIGQYVGRLPAEEEVYISPELPDHPGIRYNSGLREGLRSYNGRTCFVTPGQTERSTTYVVVPEGDSNSLPLLRSAFPQGAVVDQGPLHYGQPYFLAFRVPPGATAQVTPSHGRPLTWEGQIGLLGYDLAASAYRPGQTVQVTLYYRALQAMETDYTVFVHLLGGPNPATGGPLWAQDDSEPCRRFYTTSTWQVGEMVRDSYSVTIPDTAPPGEYRLTLGFYDHQTQTRLAATDAAGQPASDEPLLTTIHVEAR